MGRINQFAKERYRLIEELVQRVQASANSQEKLYVINQIAVIILRSRPLCRHFQGTPLTGVYQEIYQQAKGQLIEHLKQSELVANPLNNPSSQTNLNQLSPANLYKLQTNIFKQLLNDSALKKMGLAAQKSPPNSELRTYALTELVRAIKLSNRLCKPHRQKFSTKLYEVIYEEALAETMGYICLNIDLYDPGRGEKRFMNWINFKLDKNVLKYYGKHQKRIQKEIPASNNLDFFSQPPKKVDLNQALCNYFISDPEQMFQNAYIRNRPDANFINVSLAKLSGKSWEEISQRMDIPVSTLCNFYNNCLRRFGTLLKKEFEEY